MKETKKSGMSKKEMVSIGAGVAALAGAAYYFLGPNGKKHQASAKKWVLEAEKKIEQELKKGKVVSEKIYKELVDEVLKTYSKKGVATAEILTLARMLKNNWKHIAKAAKNNAVKGVKKAVRKVKKAAK